MVSFLESDGFLDVCKVGYLCKFKSMYKCFFVLCVVSEVGGLVWFEYYENEKKWWYKLSVFKCLIFFESCFNINKWVDFKNKYLVVFYIWDEYFVIVVDSEVE